MRQGLISPIIASGDSISGDIDLRGGRLQAFFVPVMTSGDLFVRGGFDTTSENFSRIQRPSLDVPTSGDLRIATGAGSCMVLWPHNLPSPSYARFESAVAQAAPRTFTVRFG